MLAELLFMVASVDGPKDTIALPPRPPRFEYAAPAHLFNLVQGEVAEVRRLGWEPCTPEVKVFDLENGRDGTVWLADAAWPEAFGVCEIRLDPYVGDDLNWVIHHEICHLATAHAIDSDKGELDDPFHEHDLFKRCDAGEARHPATTTTTVPPPTTTTTTTTVPQLTLLEKAQQTVGLDAAGIGSDGAFWCADLIGYLVGQPMGGPVDVQHSFPATDQPQPGDAVLINLLWDSDVGHDPNHPTHVAVVESITPDGVNVIEGNGASRTHVARSFWPTAAVVGYVDLP